MGIQLDPLDEKSFGEGQLQNLIYVCLVLLLQEERLVCKWYRIGHTAGAPKMLQRVIKR